jgi:hypothetical protein
MNIIEEKKLASQEEVVKVLAKFQLAFDCPHCHKEINEEHFNKGERNFQLISEKVRKLVENEVYSQRILYRNQCLEELEQTKKYEEFAGFLKLKFESEKQAKLIEKLQNQFQEQEKKSILELAKKTEEIKNKYSLEKDNLKKTVEELNIKLSGVYSSDKVEELARVKELKKELVEAKKQNDLLEKQAQPEVQALKKTVEELNIKLSGVYSSDKVEELARVKELKEKVNNCQKENEELKERNRDLIISKNKDSQKKGEDFEK